MRQRPQVLRQTSAVITAAAIAFAPAAHAGDLNAEMQKMFNDMGVLGSYSGPGAFKSQSMNLYTGGELQIRAPIRNYQLWSVALPSVKSGCGGVDAYLGSFSYINKAQFKAMLQQIGNNTVGLLFQSALASINPLIASKLEWLQNMIKDMGNFNRTSCNMAQTLVNGMSGAFDVNTYSTCTMVAQQMFGYDQQEAQEKCRTNAAGINDTARSSPDPDIRNTPPRDVNIIWDALSNTALSKDEKEMFLNISGTIILSKPDPSTGRPGLPRFLDPSIDSANLLLRGTRDGTSPGTIIIDGWWTCPDTECLNPVKSSKQITPFTTYVENILLALRDKMRSDTLPTSSEIGFVNTTSLPVYKMLSVGYTAPDEGLTDQLIARYRSVIAFDYAYTFLSRALKDARLYLHAGVRREVIEEGQAKEIRANVDRILKSIDDERAAAYARLPALNTVIEDLQRLERNMRTSLPNEIRNMIDFGNMLASRKR